MNNSSEPSISEVIRHFAGCETCFEDHGSYPESVSCYCKCHEGYEERWAKLKDMTRHILAGAGER